MKSLTTKHLIIAVVSVVIVLISVRIVTLTPPTLSGAGHDLTDERLIEDQAVGDQTAETVRVLTQQVNEVLRQNERLVQQQQLLEKKLSRANATQGLPSELDENHPLNALVTDLKQQVDSMSQQRAATYPIHNNEAETVPGYVWMDEQNSRSSKNMGLTESPASSVAAPDAPAAKPTATPAYTLPVGATLADATLMSALIGRIPVRGTVTSPYPFKALVGRDNLAANGINIPNLDGVVVTGRATGDMNLNCTHAQLDALTFVFEDGRIATTTTQGKASLGHLSTPNGNPCIPGRLFTNAPKHLSTLAGLGAIAGAANAYSEAQVKETTSGNDAGRRQVVGSHAKYVLGLAGKQSASDVSTWYRDRIDNSFDAIYTPSGIAVVINIEQQIEIDDHPEGRKTSYESDRLFATSRPLP